MSRKSLSKISFTREHPLQTNVIREEKNNPLAITTSRKISTLGHVTNTYLYRLYICPQNNNQVMWHVVIEKIINRVQQANTGLHSKSPSLIKSHNQWLHKFCERRRIEWATSIYGDSELKPKIIQSTEEIRWNRPKLFPPALHKYMQ